MSVTLNTDEKSFPYWRQNLAAMWLTEFIAIGAFSFSIPFTPYFLREIAPMLTEERIAFYTALAAMMPQVAFAIMAPLWGLLADRYGRKKMIIRAAVGGTIVLAGIGLCQSVESYLSLRLLQGLLTGTVSAAMTMVASTTPPNRQGFALGILSSAIFSGDMVGLFAGGIFAGLFGYRSAFFVSSGMFAMATVVAAVFARENFQRQEPPAPEPGVAQPNLLRRLLVMALPAMPVLALSVVGAIARMVDTSQVALFVEMLNGGTNAQGKEICTSLVLGAGSLGAMSSGLVLSRFMDRHPRRVLLTTALVAATMMFLNGVLPWVVPSGYSFSIPKFLAHGATATITLSAMVLIPLRLVLSFCSGSIDPVCNSWISRTTDPKYKGMLFGIAVTFRAVGITIAHLTAGFTVMLAGLRSIYAIATILFLVFALMVYLISPIIQRRIAQAEKA